MAIQPIHAVVRTANGTEYRLGHFKSYRIEQSIDIPADAFELVMSNQNYEVSKALSAGDILNLYLGSTPIMYGYIDDIEFNYGIDSNDVRITGRDKIALLLDNDALPATFYKLNLNEYLGKVCPKYNIRYYTNTQQKFDKITISPGETEYSVIERLAKDRKLTVYFDSNNILQCNKLASTRNFVYWFGNDDGDKAIKIKEANISISADVRDEVIVYGDNYEKNKNIKGSYKDSRMTIKKRRIISDSEIETSDDANERAKEEFYEINKDCIVVDITTVTSQVIEINKPARIDIRKAEFNAYLLIDKVVYSKNLNEGTITNITLKPMPGISVTYKGNLLPILPQM